MAKWRKDTYRLAKNHAWKARSGYQIVVLDAGAVRFDVPTGWTISPGEACIEIRDRPAPDDNCLLQVTIFPLPPSADTSALALPPLLEASLDSSGGGVLDRGLIEHSQRPNLELAWRETRFVDPGEQREARSRTCLARGGGVHTLLTFSFWPEDAARCEEVWDEILRSLRLGEYVAATTGRPIR